MSASGPPQPLFHIYTPCTLQHGNTFIIKTWLRNLIVVIRNPGSYNTLDSPFFIPKYDFHYFSEPYLPYLVGDNSRLEKKKIHAHVLQQTNSKAIFFVSWQHIGITGKLPEVGEGINFYHQWILQAERHQLDLEFCTYSWSKYVRIMSSNANGVRVSPSLGIPSHENFLQPSYLTLGNSNLHGKFHPSKA